MIKLCAADGGSIELLQYLSHPQSAELIGLMGIDCLWIDLEHQPIGMGDFENIVHGQNQAVDAML